MVQAKQSQCCAWCGKLEGKLTKDHVFPRELGGTKQLAILACETCQTIISKAEREVGRRSLFALYRIDKGPPPRHKGRPDSGAVEAKYVLVKDWLGGYGEVILRAHRDPIQLPCIEVNVTTLNAHRRGATPEDVKKVIEAVLKVVGGSPDESGLWGGVPVELLSEADADIASDPDFWPRVFLDLRDRLKIRARDWQEVERLRKAIVYLVHQDDFKNFSRWTTGQVPAGTLHRFCVEEDERALLRVVTKIAYATAYRRALPKTLESESLRHVSDFVLGTQDADTASPVRQLSSAESITEWPDHHIVLLESRRNQLKSTVILYGACFIVDLGEDPLPEVFAQPVVAMSRRDGSRTYFAPDDEGKIVAETLRYYIEKIINEKRQWGSRTDE